MNEGGSYCIRPSCRRKALQPSEVIDYATITPADATYGAASSYKPDRLFATSSTGHRQIRKEYDDCTI